MSIMIALRSLIQGLDPEVKTHAILDGLSPFVMVCRVLSLWWLVVGVPFAMVFSNRSSAAMLTIAGVILLLGTLVQHRVFPTKALAFPIEAMRHMVRGGVRQHPFLVLFAVFFTFAAISLSWTSSPAIHGWRLIEFVVPVAVTGLFLALLVQNPLPVTMRAFSFGLVFGAVLLLIELKNGAPMRAFFGLRFEEYRLNRTVVVLLLLLFPFLALIMVQKRWKAGIIVLILPVWAIFSSESGAAMLGLMVGVLTLVLALWQWRLALYAVGSAAMLAVFTAPWQGIILTEILSQTLHEHLRSTSSAIRVEIYRAFGRAVEYAPFFGSGFNVASHLEKEPAYASIPEKLNYFIEFGHAHNASLQIWVEFGLAGAVLAALILIVALRQIASAPQVIRPALLAFFAASFAIAIISHGAWQAWWAGGLGVAIIVFQSIIAQYERQNHNRSI